MIRRAAAQDLPRILRIENACFGSEAWPWDAFVDYFEQDEAVFLIAFRNSRALGYIVAARRNSGWSLDSLAVSPRAQGSGVATRLLRKLISMLAAKHAAELTLMVRRDNAAAIHLYQKFGFARTRRINGYYEDGSPAWRMRLRIAS